MCRLEIFPLIQRVCPIPTKKSNTRKVTSWDFSSSPNMHLTIHQHTYRKLWHLHGQIGEFLVLPGQPFPTYCRWFRTLGESNDGMWVQGDHLPRFFSESAKKKVTSQVFHPGHENCLPMSNPSNVILTTSDIRCPPNLKPILLQSQTVTSKIPFLLTFPQYYPNYPSNGEEDRPLLLILASPAPQCWLSPHDSAAALGFGVSPKTPPKKNDAARPVRVTGVVYLGDHPI